MSASLVGSEMCIRDSPKDMRARIPSPCLGQDHRDVRYFHSQYSMRVLNFAWTRLGMWERVCLLYTSPSPRD
eukprot:8642539-Alexandrium_andersonii.AAC.1